MGLVAYGFLGTLSYNRLLRNGILCKNIAFSPPLVIPSSGISSGLQLLLYVY